ncbi:MAG: anhydro-N-acetylmuramic acid kinase [Rhodospirillales bacterium]|nr:anhydro-N-acetylmuramic acid kinase [Alphaproteobacteria bacterium]MCB9981728.1 anhydro-N-acetylmuramic acid kinase [Rhodospirillales bacterium]
MSDKIYKAIGLMSGTSLDGEIDVALVETDGHGFVKPLGFYAHPYDQRARDLVRSCFGKRAEDVETRAAEGLVTYQHIAAVKESGFEADVIGFHGQTITHAPEDGFTWQLGDGARLAAETGMDVICDFRSADMEAGGQGAPLAPLYHAAIMAGRDGPLAVLNLGGVANVTYIDGKYILAFDTGPGNALMDDYALSHLGVNYDPDGAFAAAGQVDERAVAAFLEHPYFAAAPPKSLDRNDFEAGLPALPGDPNDALASLAAFTVEGVAASLAHFPQAPERWYVCGGGRKNAFVMAQLAARLGVPVEGIEALGHNGDAIEAECFGYLAVRSVLGLPLSLPETTGVAEPCCGGVIHPHSALKTGN